MVYINLEDTLHIKNNGDILCCKYCHKVFPNGKDAIGDCGSKEVDGKNWDVFHVNYETKDAYYGIPMLGMGLMNCMILKSDTREFLEDELQYKTGMFGSSTGKFIRGYNVQIEPIVNKMSIS